MKRAIAFAAAIILSLSTASASEATHFDTARFLADFMEDHYSMTILIGDECKGIPTEGFEYDDDYFAEDIWTYAEPKDDWFVRGYSVINEFEDRATVIEAVFTRDHDWWTQHEHIQAKLKAMEDAAFPVFGNVYDPLQY